jgi:hypothetical protein
MIGARVETTWVPGAFQLWAAMCRGESTCTALPLTAAAPSSPPAASAAVPAAWLLVPVARVATPGGFQRLVTWTGPYWLSSIEPCCVF